MLKSTMVAALAAILPSLATAQAARTHTVVPGNTLWGLAEQYLGDAFQWPRIHDANREEIPNPHRILPGLQVSIPAPQAGGETSAAVAAGPAGSDVAQVSVPLTPVAAQPTPQAQNDTPQAAQVAPAQAADGQGVTPVAAAEPAPAAPAQPELTADPQQVPPRTVFYRERQLDVTTVHNAAPQFDVAPDQFYSAPWLIPPATVPEASGFVQSLDGGRDLRNGRSIVRMFDRVQVRTIGGAPAIGSRLQVLRVARDIFNVGQVVQPTGILLVESVTPAGVIAVVEAQFDRVELGDLVRPLPSFIPAPAGSTIAVTGGAEATVLAYSEYRDMQSFGDYAFIDAGLNEGVRIGDEYVVVVEDTPDFGRAYEGRLKVVSVLQNVATARVVAMENPVFPPGVRLRPDRRAR